MVQSECCILQIALYEAKQGFNWQAMLEICLDSEIKDELTKIKRKNSIDEFCSFVIQEFAFTFDLISLLRKHSLELPSHSPLSNQKKKIFNCGKVWKELNDWTIVMGIWFWKFKAISSNCPSQFVKFAFLLDANCRIRSKFWENFVHFSIFK